MKEFKPINIPEDYMKSGIYFKSDNDISTQYLIELKEGKFEGNVLIKIYSTDIIENHIDDTNGLVTGCKLYMPINDCIFVCEVDLCGKYFFPKFNNELQLYYDEKKYYKGKNNTNSITSLMECINYAIEYGLKKSNIIPY